MTAAATRSLSSLPSREQAAGAVVDARHVTAAPSPDRHRDREEVGYRTPRSPHLRPDVALRRGDPATFTQRVQVLDGLIVPPRALSW